MTRPFLLLCCLSFILFSCSKDVARHELKLGSNSIILYADQTRDSLSFYTFDSWTVTPQVDWITVYGDSYLDINYDYMNRYQSTVMFDVQPNTTGKTRCGAVLIKSYYTSAVPFYQLGVLNVRHPNKMVGTWLNEREGFPDEVHYELVDSAHWTEDSICFNVENAWGLEFVGDKPSWIVMDKEEGRPGMGRVNLTFVPNGDKENGREAKLKLTSGVVSNEIVVRQLPAKEEEE